MENSRTPPERSSILDNFLGVSEVILTVLKDVSAVSPVPLLSDAAKLSLVILETVQAVRENKALWIGLAADIACLVAAVAAKVDNTVSCSLDSDTLDQIKQLNGTLRGLEDTVRRMVSRSIFRRIVGARGDASEVQKYRKNLDLAIDLLGVRAAITNAENMQRIRFSQQRLIAGQEGIHSKQDELLSNQRMTTELLRKIDTTISSQTGSLASPPSSMISICPDHATSTSPSLTQSATPSSPLKGFPLIVPENAKIIVITGDQIVNSQSQRFEVIRWTIHTSNRRESSLLADRRSDSGGDSTILGRFESSRESFALTATNINSVTNNSHSNRVKHINTTNSHNTYTTSRSGAARGRRIRQRRDPSLHAV